MNERNTTYLERRNYVSDTQKMSSRRFSKPADTEMKSLPKKLSPLDNRRSSSYMSNGPNSLDPLLLSPSHNTA